MRAYYLVHDDFDVLGFFFVVIGDGSSVVVGGLGEEEGVDAFGKGRGVFEVVAGRKGR